MADETKIGSLPVVSEGIKAEIFAAFARIEQVPCTATLIDMIDKDLWDSADEYGIEAGSADMPDDMDNIDVPQKMIA